MRPIYEIKLDSAAGEPDFLDQFKGKVTLVVNTTVGCGNANQLEVLQWLQDKYDEKDFQVIAVPTNDFCGPGVTKGKWSQGITCGLDSQEYGREVYKVTFKYSEMVTSNPNDLANELSEHKGDPTVNGLGQPVQETHDLYKEISNQMLSVRAAVGTDKGEFEGITFMSPWLNKGLYGGAKMGGNFEKYLIDSDGYVMKHFPCTMLNYDIEKTLKESLLAEGIPATLGEDRSPEVFDEEFALICNEIEKAISGAKSAINPNR